MTASDITTATGRVQKTESTEVSRILLTVLFLLVGWATSVAMWGIPGLYIPALAMVPVIWVFLIIISRG